MNLLTIDFETYYAQDYGLRKLTTEEYIRDPRFEVIGVAVKQNNEPTVHYSGDEIGTFKSLKSFDWDNSVAIAHNARFDMAILNWRFQIKPKKIVDTLGMARAIHGTEVGGSLKALVEHYKLGAKGTEIVQALGLKRLDFSPKQLAEYMMYCENDVNLTYDLFRCLIKDFPKTELDLIDLTTRMFTEPVIELEKQVLTEHILDVQLRKQELLNSVTDSLADLRSNPKFADLLRSHGVEPPMKTSLTTGKETYAFAKTDEDFKELLEHPNEYVRTLVEVRMGVRSSIEETRTERFIGIAERGTLPVPLRYYAAHTGRWGGDDKINMQNLKRDSKLKYAMRAPKGYKFVDCDLAQIEARMLAYLAEQEDLVEAFDKGDDVYTIMASNIYSKAQEDIDKGERFVGKMTILGCGYGMGAVRFQEQLKAFHVEIEDDESVEIIGVYRSTYSAIPALWAQAGQAIEAILDDKSFVFGRDDLIVVDGVEGIRLPNGLYLKYPNLRKEYSEEDGRYEYWYDQRRGRSVIPTRIYGGKLIENICQAFARIVIGEQLVRVSKKYKVAMTVHDAIGSIVPEAEEDSAKKFVEQAMRIRPTWAPDLPLDCEAFSGDSYGDCKEK